MGAIGIRNFATATKDHGAIEFLANDFGVPRRRYKFGFN